MRGTTSGNWWKPATSAVGINKKLRRLSTMGYDGYTFALLDAYAPMLTTQGDWQI